MSGPVLCDDCLTTTLAGGRTLLCARHHREQEATSIGDPKIGARVRVTSGRHEGTEGVYFDRDEGARFVRLDDGREIWCDGIEAV